MMLDLCRSWVVFYVWDSWDGRYFLKLL